MNLEIKDIAVINKQHLISVLCKPYFSEKTNLSVGKHKQFVFKVISSATKIEIKLAVEMLFNVKVEAVKICNVKAKIKRFKQLVGRRKEWKKAYIILKPGYDINFIDFSK